jgi:TolB-like protein/Tfp pilus assembly protein PilF
MTPDAWRRVKTIVQDALERPADQRAAFVAEACGDDSSLRAEVESLLVGHERAGSSFLQPLSPGGLPHAMSALAGAARALRRGDRLGPYEVVDALGAGGMGEVYRARDTRLNRTVAIKVLPPQVAHDPQARQRFEREARAIAALNHPHICTLHDFGHQEESAASGPVDYLVMEYLDGETLAARLEKGALPIAEALRYASQIATALDKAHRAGITHRDLKPGNIFLVRNEGAAALPDVKLLDFGLAKASGLPAGDGTSASATDLTTPGAIVGTVPYMAPEQLAGRDTDARTDIFSFGAVLYEMVTGRRAFAGDSQASVIAAILDREPAPPSTLAPVPSEFDPLVRRCVAKNPGDRYQSARELLHEIEALERGSSRAIRPTGRRLAAASAVAALAVMAVLVWRVQPATLPAADISEGRSRLVVLPFENLTRQAADDWLAGGFSDSITFGLQALDSLILVNRELITEIYRDESIREAGPLDPQVVRRLSERLQVRYYVHGSYQRIGDQIRVVARLVEGGGTIKVQESVTDRFANILQVEDDLARRFAAALEAGSSTSPRAETVSLEAYQAYTEARGAYANSPRSYQDARTKLERAVTLDPNYAAAWALLGKLLARMAAPGALGTQSVEEELRHDSLAAATRAVELAPSSYEARVALALAHRAKHDREPWRAAALAAVNLNPRMAEAYSLVAESYSSTADWGCDGDRDQRLADEYFHRALDIDPLFGPAYTNLAIHLRETDRADESVRVCDRGLAMLPNYLSLKRVRAVSLLSLNRVDEGEEALNALLRVQEPNRADLNAMAHVHILRGRLDQADKLPARGSWNLLRRAHVMATHGEIDRAAAIFGQSFEIEPACARYVATTPAYASVVSLPPIRNVLARHGAAK